ncbi:MAG: stage 0 sporulation family protein [Bacillota bacterium]|nr:stage 0 sporulation family protein [Bacillota bacterium]
MIDVVAVRFKKAGKLYYFDPAGIEIKEQDAVIVETSRGVEFGTVISQKRVEAEDLHSDLKQVLRVATEEDRQVERQNKVDADYAREECKQIIAKHGLEMDLVDAEYTFDKSKIIFYFTAEGRIDFRELVKELASVFRTRIELRQIGVRDEAKLLDSLGHCGKKTCCSSWVGEFMPVSIKMAKEQNLSLNPSKISGVCGRLLCCLKYEYDHYLETNKKLPSINEVVKVSGADAVTVSTNPVKEEVTVRRIAKVAEDGSFELSNDYEKYRLSEIKRKR